MDRISGGTSTTVRFLQEENLRLLEQNQGLQEENAYLRETLKSLRGLLGAVARIDVNSELDRLLNRIVYEATRIVDAVDGSLILVDHEKQELVFVTVRSHLRERLVGYRMPIDEGIVGWVVAHQEPVIANDVAHDERFSTTVDRYLAFVTRSLMAVPLVSRGQVLGAIELVNKFSSPHFDERDLETLSLLAGVAATSIDLAGM